jgi:HD-like signal output (HDOD) protein
MKPDDLPAARRIAAVEHEIDTARTRGPLQQIQVPPCPELLTRLRAAMAPREPDLQAVARVAEADVAMAATLIRNANGAAFAGLPPVQSVGQAMLRLGLGASATLMTAFLVRHALPVRSPALRGFWEDSTRKAAAMGWLAAQLPGVSIELAHGVGLFSHVGQPVLMQSVRGYAGTLAEAAARRDRPMVATENANHRTDHAVAGALTARAWRMDGALVAAVRLHHSFEVLGSADTEAEVQTLVALLLVAETLLRRHAGRTPDADWTAHGASALQWLQASPDELAHWEEQLQPVFDQAVA